jgi:putative glutamine amidotransferase
MTTGPYIGVTGPDRGGFAAWTLTSLALRRAGAKPIRITPSRPRRIDDLDGLILGGGADIDPERYGQTVGAPEEDTTTDPRRSWHLRLLTFIISPIIILLRKLDSLNRRESTINRDRDQLEGELLALAVERDMPVLGICRGSQFLNVHFGGTLHQDIEEFYVEELKRDSVWPRKKVLIEPDTHLAVILGCDECRVNSLHNQAADTLGEGLRVVARDRDGVVQAIEHEHHTFVVGVQWHPEYLPQLPEQHRLFRRLVHEAQRFAEAGVQIALGGKQEPIRDFVEQSQRRPA